MHESPDNTLSMPMFGCSSGSGMTNGNVISKGNKGLVIANLNTNSLIKHIDEIRIFLAQHDIEILAINESKLDNSISDNEIAGYRGIAGYTVCRKEEIDLVVGWSYISVIIYHTHREMA